MMDISLNAFVSLDGVVQGPGAPDEDTSNGFALGGWLVPFERDDWGLVVDSWFDRTSAILLGRNTFAMMRAYWSQVTDPENKIAAALNHGKKYVVSSTLSDMEAAWNDTTVLRGDVVEAVRALKAAGDGELQVHGSWQLASTLHEAGLVDIYRILQFPVVVGSGKRLFGDDATPAGFDVLHAETLSDGVVSLELRRTRLGSPAVGRYIVEGGREATSA